MAVAVALADMPAAAGTPVAVSHVSRRESPRLAPPLPMATPVTSIVPIIPLLNDTTAMTGVARSIERTRAHDPAAVAAAAAATGGMGAAAMI